MSKLYHAPICDDKVIIGEYRVDIEADKIAESKLASIFAGVGVFTTTEGKKLIPIQELIKIERQMEDAKEKSAGKGYQNGYEKGLAEGHREAQKVIDNFAGLIKDAVKQRDILFEEAHRKILELVIKIAGKVTFDAARIDPDVTSDIIAGTIRKLVDKSKIKVKVHPDHLPSVEQQIDRFRSDSTAIKEIAFESDSRVRYGGCFIETPTGDIDARIDSQLEIIADTLEACETLS